MSQVMFFLTRFVTRLQHIARISNVESALRVDKYHPTDLSSKQVRAQLSYFNKHDYQ